MVTCLTTGLLTCKTCSEYVCFILKVSRLIQYKSSYLNIEPDLFNLIGLSYTKKPHHAKNTKFMKTEFSYDEFVLRLVLKMNRIQHF